MTNYVTKDSGERQTFATGMERDAVTGKLRPDLVYGPMLIRWSALMGRGAEKYGERNWEKAETEEELARFKQSAFRHFVQWFYDLAPEEDHAAAVFFNISGAEYVKERLAQKGRGALVGAVECPPDSEKAPADVKRYTNVEIKVNGASWGGVESVDVEPVKPRFKVGDRVRIVGKPYRGRTGTIGDVNEDTRFPIRVDFDQDEAAFPTWYRADELALVSGAV